jgi:hypothetical protein
MNPHSVPLLPWDAIPEPVLHGTIREKDFDTPRAEQGSFEHIHRVNHVSPSRLSASCACSARAGGQILKKKRICPMQGNRYAFETEKLFSVNQKGLCKRGEHSFYPPDAKSLFFSSEPFVPGLLSLKLLRRIPSTIRMSPNEQWAHQKDCEVALK